MALEKLWTPQELADYCSLPLATVYQWRYRGGGPVGMRIGRFVRFRQSAVEDWLASSEASDLSLLGHRRQKAS